jgi:hypothetical protein
MQSIVLFNQTKTCCMKKNFLHLLFMAAFVLLNLESFSQFCGANLVVNGDFEAGNTGFTSGYTNSPGNIIPAGTYEVAITPSHPCFAGPDHTSTGPGYAMYVNGASTPNTIVWSQNISVVPNTNYYFSSWIKGQCGNSNPAILQFSINGSQIGSNFNPTSSTEWQQFFTQWNSGPNTTATIRLINQNTAAGGNDFGLDDIVFNTTAPVQVASATSGKASCSNASDGSITITASGGIEPFQFSKDGGANYVSSSNPYTFTGLAPGPYSIKVKDNCGNESNAQNVTVGYADVVKPTLNNVPPDATYECDAIQPAGNVTASDNCDGSITTNYYVTPTIKTKLVHHWTADGNYNDAVDGANGIPSGAVTATGEGIIGSNSFSFNGTTGYISTGTAGSIAGTGNFSVSAWVKTTSNSPMVVIQQRAPGSINGEYMFKIGGNHNNSILNPGKVYLLVFGSGSPVVDLFSTTTVNDGKWHQIVGERDGSNLRIYIDGNLSASGSTVVPVSFTNSISTTIGRDARDNNSYFSGLIDDIKVWSSPDCPSKYEFDRVWTATDASGNQSAAIQHVSVQDTKAPTLTGTAYAGTSGTNACKANAATSVPAFSAANAIQGYTDNCSSSVTATLTNTTVTGTDCNWAVVYTFTVKDECGNELKDQTYSHTGSDQTAPTITSCTPSVFHCYDDVTSPGEYSVPPVAATDACGGTVTYSFSISAPTNRSGSGNDASGTFAVGTSTITWTAKDPCGNATQCTTTVTINPAMSATIPDVTGVSPGGNPNTIYIGYGPTSLTITAMPTGGTPFAGPSYTYSWSPGGATTKSLTVNPSMPGSYTYTVTVTDSKGCKTTASKTITVVDARCGNKNDKVIVCQVPPGNPGNAHTICISADAVATHLANGSYLGACTTGNVTTRAELTEETMVTPGILLYPNPNKGDFRISLKDIKLTKGEITILDGRGNVVERKNVQLGENAQSINMSLKKLSPGMYYVRVVGENGPKTVKFIILR